jgi:hypothetical protein
MHLPINVKSPNNISKWQMGFNSAFKGLIVLVAVSFTALYVAKIPLPFLYFCCKILRGSVVGRESDIELILMKVFIKFWSGSFDSELRPLLKAGSIKVG